MLLGSNKNLKQTTVTVTLTVNFFYLNYETQQHHHLRSKCLCQLGQNIKQVFQYLCWCTGIQFRLTENKITFLENIL